MNIIHNEKKPIVDPSSWVAPNAVLCGDVTIGPGCRIQYGAQIIAESCSIKIGRECIIMENAVLRSSSKHQLLIGDNCLVGPNAHVVGSIIENEVFIIIKN